MLPKIAVIGAGTMGGALIKGLLREALIDPRDLIAVDPWEERRAYLKAQYNVETSADNAAAARQAEIVFLSVKPQVMHMVFADLRGVIRPEMLVFSIAAGVPVSKIQRGLEVQSVIRAMPNTPAQIGQGITVWTATPAVSEQQRAHALTILRALGEEVYVEDEHYLDMATALSGTGPAYIYLFMEAMVDAGVHLGFSRHVARNWSFDLIGQRTTPAVWRCTSQHWRNQVTSPGGTTLSANLWTKGDSGRYCPEHLGRVRPSEPLGRRVRLSA